MTSIQEKIIKPKLGLLELAKAEREGRLVDKICFHTRASILIVDEIG